MKHGIYLPPFGDFADPRRVAELAADAEKAGWDGFFIWDHMFGPPAMPVAEAWTTLAAIAMTTSRVRFGAMVTPLARRRPWTLARQIATLDQLSGGRLVVGIGLGDDGWNEFGAFGEETSPRSRGELLDDSLEVLLLLLSGNAVSYRGARYNVDADPMLPVPVQNPVPVWAAVRWPNRKPIVRAARLQGCFPIFPRVEASGRQPEPPPVAEVDELLTELVEIGLPRSYDMVVRFSSHRLDAAARVDVAQAIFASGATWMLEGFGVGQAAAEVEAVVRGGPPTS